MMTTSEFCRFAVKVNFKGGVTTVAKEIKTNKEAKDTLASIKADIEFQDAHNSITLGKGNNKEMVK